MRNRETSYALRVAESLADSPAPRLRGDRCKASLVLHNPGGERAIVRSAVVRDLDGLRGPPGASFVVRLPTVLRPESSARVPLGFDIPSAAVAGSYRFEVSVAGVDEQMTLEVPPRLRMRLSPSEIVITDLGTSSHVVLIENLGNVAFSVVGNVAVPLDDELIVCRSLRGGLALFDEVEEEDVTFDRLFARAAKTAHAALDGAILGVHFSTATDPIEPGSTASVTVDVDAPTGLDPRTRYTAAVPVLTATLGVVVLPSKVGGMVRPTTSAQPTRSSSKKKATKAN